MIPGDIIKDFRKKNKISQKEFAHTLGFSQPYVNRIEKNFRKPSRKFLEKLHKKYGISADYILYGKTLPTTNQDIEKSVSEGMMPLKFIERLKRDIENLSNSEEFYLTVSIPKSIILSVLDGKGYLTRSSVVDLAQKLNQPIYEYLILSHYMPDEIINFFDLPASVHLFKQISMLTRSELEEVLQTISQVIKPYIKKHQKEDKSN